MLRLPTRFAAVILSFAPLFFQRSWRHAEVLLIGAILAPGKRTVTSLLRVAGLARERRFVNYHRVLSRAAWSSRAASRLLLGHLIRAFAPSGPVVLGIDDTIERRRGKRIAAKGIYRDPVRSSHGHFVKASGLRWISLMLLAPVPWAGRVWALPFLTALAPSERYCRVRGLRHKKLTDWARQLVVQARRWLPQREIVVVGDSGFAALELLAALAHHKVTSITRLRLDAALYDPAPPRLRGTNGRPRTKGARLPNLSEVLKGTRHALAAGDGPGLVRRGRARSRSLHRDRRLASRRHAHRADPLGVGPRSPTTVRPAGSAVHRPTPRARADPQLVRPTLATGGHLSGNQGASRRRNPAPMVEPRRRPHHAMPACAVLPRHPPGRAAQAVRPRGRRQQCLVSQTTSNLQRHPRCRATPHLARAGFAHVTAQPPCCETPTRTPTRLGLRHLPRRLMAKVELRWSPRL